MKTATVAMMMMAVAVTGRAQGTTVAPSTVIREPRVIAAMKHAWVQTLLNKVKEVETGFHVDAAGGDYTVVPEPESASRLFAINQRLVPGVTVALFHVHPSKVHPDPSQADRKIADRYGVQIYTMHARGLYVYDPVTKQTTKLRDDLSWLKP